MKTPDENMIAQTTFAGYCDANECESGGVCVCLVFHDQLLDIWCLNHPRVLTRCSHAKKIFFSRGKLSLVVTHDRYCSMWATLKVVTRPPSDVIIRQFLRNIFLSVDSSAKQGKLRIMTVR
jgi:hypothetical protein